MGSFTACFAGYRFERTVPFLKNLAPWLLIFTTMFGNGGIFCWYSYVTPLMTHVAGFSENSMTFIMVLAGLSMTVGNLMGGKFSDQYGAARVVKYTQIIMASSFACHFLCSFYLLAGSDIDVCMYGRIICCFGSTTIIVTPKFTRRRNDGSGLCASRF